MFKYALSVAKKFGSRLTLMHAFGRPEPLVTNKDDEEREKIVLEKLHQFAKEHAGEAFKDVNLDFIAMLDYPTDAILHLAERREVDLIVLGMTGRADPGDRFFGTNAYNVVQRASCPVLAIPSTCTWRPVEQIVFTTNFEFDDLRVLSLINSYFDNPHINVLHVLRKDADRDRELKKFHALKTAFIHHENIDFDFLTGEVQATIESYCVEKNADLLAMTTHKRNLITMLLDKSTARKMAKKMRFPMLVFKEE